MPEIKNTFLKGKMNKSLDDRILPEGEYRDALNIQVTKSDGADVGVVHNIKGTITKASASGFSAGTVIGSIFDDKSNRIFYFVTDNTVHKIYKWAKGDTAATAIVSGTFLNFHKNNLITGINIIEDYLFWTDNRNQPRRINITKAITNNGFYDSEEKISVAKYSPHLAPTISMSYSSNVSNNYIEDKFVRFSYRFKYEDNEYSQIAPFSQIAFKTQTDTLTSDQIQAAYEDGLLANFVNYINEVDVEVDLPTNPYTNYQIRSVEFLMKDANSSAVRIIGRKNVTANAATSTYTYKSELPVSTLAEDQVVRVSEQIPTRAQAQEVSGNRIIYGNYTQNYDIPDFTFTVSSSQKSSAQNTEYPYHTIKQRRNYEVGVVLSDKYGRKSPVILSNSNVYVAAKPINFNADDYDTGTTGNQAWYGDTLKIEFDTNNLPSDWGDWETYRIVVKQTEQEYYNVFLPGVASYDGKSYITLLGDNINKIPRNDTTTAYNEMSTSSTRLYPKIINRSNYYSAYVDYNIVNGEITYKTYVISNDSTSQFLIVGGYTSPNIQTLLGSELQTSGTSKYYNLLEDDIANSLAIDYVTGYEKPSSVDVYVNGKLQFGGIGGVYTYTSTSGSYGRITWTAANAPVSTDKIDVIVKYDKLEIDTDNTATIGSLTIMSRISGSTNYTITAGSSGGVFLSVSDNNPFSDNIGKSNNYQLLSDDGLVKVISIGTLDNFTNLPKDDLPTQDDAGFYKQSDANLIAELNFATNVIDLTQHVVDLAVFETEPFKSSLDIYYESSTSGSLSDLSSINIININYFNAFVLKGDLHGSTSRWHIEESRIRGDYNADSVDYGVQAHITNTDYKEQTRENALIYSGIYNERTGVNNTNQFPSGQNITKALDIQNGSIQKLFSENTNLTVFQEEKVSWIAIDKDIIYTAEGSPQVTSAKTVLGQVVPYTGNYGIGKNPESFAFYAGRKYFVDKPKGLVLRLSRDGITEISNYGMRSYFRDNLKNPTNTDRVVGAWDMYNQDYIVSMQWQLEGEQHETLAFDESANGWSTRYSYRPEFGGSIDGDFYTFKNGNLYLHYNNSAHNNFYGTQYNSQVDLIFNLNASLNKNFLSINYEGTNTWNISYIQTDVDDAENIAAYSYTNDDLIISGFKKYDNKYFANIINKASIVKGNEVVLGSNMSGVKGHFMKLKVLTNDNSYQELFSVSTNYNINSY